MHPTVEAVADSAIADLYRIIEAPADSWEERSKDDGIVIHSRKSDDKDCSVEIVRLRMTLEDSDLPTVLAILSPWLPYRRQFDEMLEDAVVLEDLGNGLRLIRHVTKKKFPLSSRDSVDAVLVHLEPSRVVMVSRSVPHPSYPPKEASFFVAAVCVSLSLNVHSLLSNSCFKMHCFHSSPSSSSQSEDDCPAEMSPTQLLSLAIQKRRALFGRKDRDYRQELLQTGFIQSLCKHLGERRARRRRRGGKRSISVQTRQNKGTESSTEVPIARVEPVLQTVESPPPVKRARLVDDEDPFGLEDFFAEMRRTSDKLKGSEVRS